MRRSSRFYFNFTKVFYSPLTLPGITLSVRAPNLAEQANGPSSATVVAGSSIKLAVICDHWGYAKSVLDSAVHVHGSIEPTTSFQLLGA